MPIRTALTFHARRRLHRRLRARSAEPPAGAGAGAGGQAAGLVYRLARLPGALRRLPRREAATGTDKAPNLLERVQTLGPAQLRRPRAVSLRLGHPGRAGGSEKARARGAGRGDPAAPPGAPIQMPAWQNEPRDAGAHRRPLCLAVGARPGVRRGPDRPTLRARPRRGRLQAPGACGMGRCVTPRSSPSAVTSVPPARLRPTVPMVQIGPQGMPHQPSSSDSAHQGAACRACSRRRTKCTAELRLNDISSSEMQY